MGNFSRDTFDRLKHYVGVRLQQGVPLVDADWNEQEDIRKYELQAFLKWYIGDGVPAGNNGFLIANIDDTTNNDFIITGGDGTLEGAGRCLVDGWDVVNELDIKYSEQTLYIKNDQAVEIAADWGVDVLPALTFDSGPEYLVYLDVWEREVDSNEDRDLINSTIGLETAVRRKREWVVRVNDIHDQVVGHSIPELPDAPAGHSFYSLARIHARIQDSHAGLPHVVDLRNTNLSLSDLQSTLANHLSDRSNPHNVRAAQVGALAASDYDFTNRLPSGIIFTQNDANDAIRTINIGFRPSFVWIVGSAEAFLKDRIFRTNVSAYADLRGREYIQQCTHTNITLGVEGIYSEQDDDIEQQCICAATFTDSTTSPPRSNRLVIDISKAIGNNSKIIAKLNRHFPFYFSGSSTHSDLGLGVLALPLEGFKIQLQMLFFGKK